MGVTPGGHVRRGFCFGCTWKLFTGEPSEKLGVGLASAVGSGMPQFESVLARRKHQIGDGLRQQFPLPAGPTIPCTVSDLVAHPPELPPGVMAGLVRRYYMYSQGYAKMATRYAARDPFLGWGPPVSYLNGPLNAAVESLLGNVYAAGLVHIHSNYPVEGGDYNGAIIDQVEIPWSLEDEETHAFATLPVSDDWLPLPDGSFVGLNVRYPGGGFRTDQGDGHHEYLHWPSNGEPFVPGLFGAGVQNLTNTAYIYAFLYGKLPAPTLFESPRGRDRYHEPGQFASDYIAIAGGNAGRIIWQMVWMEWQLMVDDLTERQKGGRGGKPKGAGGSVLAAPIMPGGGLLPVTPMPKAPTGYYKDQADISDALIHALSL